MDSTVIGRRLEKQITLIHGGEPKTARGRIERLNSSRKRQRSSEKSKSKIQAKSFVKNPALAIAKNLASLSFQKTLQDLSVKEILKMKKSKKRNKLPEDSKTFEKSRFLNNTTTNLRSSRSKGNGSSGLFTKKKKPTNITLDVKDFKKRLKKVKIKKSTKQK